MKPIVLTLLLISCSLMAAEAEKVQPKKEEWQNTSLSDETIKNIQAAKMRYNTCVVEEMKKSDSTIESRRATESIIKNCEKILGDIRKVYTDEDVPEVIADRHLKQMRIQTTRNVLQQLMYQEAARKSMAIDAAAAKK